MIGYLVRCRLPLKDLGRLDWPKMGRFRYRNGYIRLWRDERAQQVIATLEDKDGRVIPMATPAEAYAESLLMGQTLAVGLQRWTKYEIGEPTGNPGQVRVAT